MYQPDESGLQSALVLAVLTVLVVLIVLVILVLIRLIVLVILVRHKIVPPKSKIYNGFVPHIYSAQLFVGYSRI